MTVFSIGSLLEAALRRDKWGFYDFRGVFKQSMDEVFIIFCLVVISV